jgi:hypothetical protein
MENLKKQIVSEINAMSQSDLINLNNIYAREIQGNFDNEIWDNDEDFFNSFFENDVMGVVRAISYGDFRFMDNFVKFDGYGNLESFNFFDINDLCELPETMAVDIINNFIEFSYMFSSELEALINEYEF